MPTYDMSAAYGGADRPAEPDRPAVDRRPRPRDRFGRPLPRDAPDEMAHAEEPEEVAPTLEAAFEQAVALFDEQRFFEAHEFFEHIWKSDWIDPADADFWKGATQVAVGCCHVQRGNDTGALALLDRAARHLADAPDRHHGVDVPALVEIARHVAAQAREQGASPDLDFPAFPRADEA
jgi:predicted metal-dependent hydrolase